MDTELNTLAEHNNVAAMSIESPYIDACSRYPETNKICDQYGVSQPMGEGYVNYTVAAYYPESLKNNTLFNENFIDDNGASAVQAGFNSWIKRDPSGTFTSYLSEEEIKIQDKSCEDFRLKVIAKSSMVSNSKFKYGNDGDGFITKFDHLCDLARGIDPDDNGGSTDYSFLWYIGGGVAAFLCFIGCCMKVYKHDGRVNDGGPRAGLLGWDHVEAGRNRY